MKTLTRIIAAAGIAVATIAAAAPAEAQRYRGDRHEQRYDRHDRGHHRGYNRGWDRRYAYRGRYHRHCWVEWRHHHRVRICR
ncbi:hypothetical protein [Sphingomonas sp. dw_22]|uniref:hypothetical protein n=1 Tax=Sphingomonas sp. dw_22 TaxID=2721175 RepID=UPI001BD2D575|nr:hypothetical protein [Sphingomonas sp. dw_22]